MSKSPSAKIIRLNRPRCTDLKPKTEQEGDLFINYKERKWNHAQEPGFHSFDPHGGQAPAVAAAEARKLLLDHYDKTQRILPWRRPSEGFHRLADPNKPDAIAAVTDCLCGKVPCVCYARFHTLNRAYCVWVSEIMLQQTQVNTVIPYFIRWMDAFPTIESLASASEERVYQLWTGLGYYSRAQRIRETAIYLVEKLSSEIPRDPKAIEVHLGGVGPYTAGAIASIAYNEVCPTVDGNIARIYSRLRSINKETTNKKVIAKTWELARELVDPERPGDFNQALMDLGSTICTPKSPACSICPLKTLCYAYYETQNVSKQPSSGAIWGLGAKRKKISIDDPDGLGCTSNAILDMEDACDLCDVCDIRAFKVKLNEQDIASAIMSLYPTKPAKKKSREENVLVLLLHHRATNSYLIKKRPSTGLLANMAEFVCVEDKQIKEHSPALEDFTYKTRASIMETYLREHLQLTMDGTDAFQERKDLDVVKHVFTHINCRYHLEYMCIDSDRQPMPSNTSAAKSYSWVSYEDLLSTNLSTGMKKALEKLDIFFKASTSKPKSKAEAETEAETGTGNKKMKSKTQPTLFTFLAKKQTPAF